MSLRQAAEGLTAKIVGSEVHVAVGSEGSQDVIMMDSFWVVVVVAGHWKQRYRTITV